jgi:cytochrome c biogenesis factor
MTNVISPLAEMAKNLGAKDAKAKKTLTLASPELVKAISVAVEAENVTHDKWVSAASKLSMSGVKYGHIIEDSGIYVKATYERIRDIVVQAQKPNIVTLLVATSTIGFTDQERSDKRYHKNRVDNIHMKRIAEHLKKFEETSRGAQAKKTKGQIYAAYMQKHIDALKKMDEEKIDFDCVLAMDTLKKAKAIFLKKNTD